MGFRVRARTGDRLQGLRINFPREVRTPLDARAVLVTMTNTHRELKDQHWQLYRELD